MPGAAMDDDLFGRIIRTFGLPVAGWAAFCAIIVHWWRNRNERLRDVAAERNSGWGHMQELHALLAEEVRRLSERLKSVEAENEECRKNLQTVRDDLEVERAARVRMEAYLEGRGQAEQHAQLIVSAERQKLEHKRENE